MKLKIFAKKASTKMDEDSKIMESSGSYSKSKKGSCGLSSFLCCGTCCDLCNNFCPCLCGNYSSCDNGCENSNCGSDCCGDCCGCDCGDCCGCDCCDCGCLEIDNYSSDCYDCYDTCL